MPVAFQPESPQYVYAVIPADRAPDTCATGVDAQPLGTVRHGKLAALVSPAVTERIRPSRANLTAHEEVVGWAHRRGPTMPIRFGTVMPGETAVLRDLLEPGRHQFETLLAEFAGKDEYRIKCRYLPDVAVREVLEASRTIQRLRAQAGRGASPAAQVRLGELVFAGLERLRHRDGAAVMDVLGGHVIAWEPIEDRSDEVALHAAVLVDRSAAERMEQSLERFGRSQRSRLRIELIGPLPLWDFTQAMPGAA